MRSDEVFGFLRPAIDAHTLGLSMAVQLLHDCNYTPLVANAAVCEAANEPAQANNSALIAQWITETRITRLGFSYRLDPVQAAALFGKLMYQIKSHRLLAEDGGKITHLYFAGLPEACARVHREQGDRVILFIGDETPGETLEKLGIPPAVRPAHMTGEIEYDTMRIAFARDLLKQGKHLEIKPVDRSGCKDLGSPHEHLAGRLEQSMRSRQLPLMRAHVGPYLPNRDEAVRLFLEWSSQLAKAGFLDVLSIGTSQLSQSAFGEPWEGKQNGGGVPVNSADEFRAIWRAARPMLVRTYAGTKNIPALARMYEETINCAWHALSFWWFCAIDNRGSNSVADNITEHFETIKVIAAAGKPFEANVPHHFSFRGADDCTYVAAGVVAASVAKSLGIRHYVLQIMLNTPKYTWGIQDLAKARALLYLVRRLEDKNFTVILQPRAGLDYFSPDLEKAKVQLAAVTALMDDIEPRNTQSPAMVHVVSYSEAAHLATPAVVNESIKITRAALNAYRTLKAQGKAMDMASHAETAARTQELIADASALLAAIEKAVPAPYSPQGLYDMFATGFFPVPYLWECKEEFARAIAWPTRVVHGSVKCVDDTGKPLPVQERIEQTLAWRKK